MSYTDSGFDKRLRNLLVAFASVAPPPPPPPPPPAPPTGMLLRLNGADIAVADGAPISTWPDSSGNGLDGTAAGAQRPTLNLVSSINSMPAAAFDDTVGQFFNLPTGFADFTAGFALYVVHAAVDTLAVAKALFGLSNNAVSSAYSAFINTADDSTGVVALQPGLAFIAAVGLPYSPCVFEVHIPSGAGGSSVTGEVYLNHVLIASGAIEVPENLSRNLNFVGNDAIPGVSPYRGEMAELILYASALTAPQRAEMDAYLLDRYAL